MPRPGPSRPVTPGRPGRPGRALLATAALAACVLLRPAPAGAEVPEGKIELGIIGNFSSMDQQIGSKSPVVAVELAREDFEAEGGKLTVEIHTSGEFQPGTEPNIVRDWLDKEHLSALVMLGSGATEPELAPLLAARHRAAVSIPLTTLDPAKGCAPTVVQWGGGAAVLGRTAVEGLYSLGAKRWVFAPGNDQASATAEAGARSALQALGGTVVATTPDLTGYANPDRLAKTLNGNEDVIAYGQTGTELYLALRNSLQLGLGSRTKLVALDMDRQPLPGQLDAARGVYFPTTWWPERDDAARQFTARFVRRMRAEPTEDDAAAYAATLALLRAIQAAKSIEAAPVIDAMRSGLKTDKLFGAVTVTGANVVAFPTYLLQVQTATEASGGRRGAILAATVPPDKAFPSAAGAGCGG